MKQFFVIFIVLTVLVIISCSQKPDVVTTESGMKYLDLNVGEGRIAKSGDLVSIHFRGWLVMDSLDLFSDWVNDSTKKNYLFADSYLQGSEVKLLLGSYQFIKGSEEGILGMQLGGKRIIIIPSELAYGKQGAGPIPPNTDIKVFVEILKIDDPKVVKKWDVEDDKIQVTESGLKYAILEPGEGSNPENGNVVTVHYTGYFEDGIKFDSSVERDEPFSFVVGNRQVIPGWDEGIRLLKKGGKAKFIIPPSLGYGAAAIGSIPPNSTLIFDVELVDVK
jgi:peptidylprolyl isomerase